MLLDSPQVTSEFFSNLEITIARFLVCAGFQFFGVRYLAKEAFDFYEDFRERRKRWRSGP
jgi:hypothetical protein